MTDGIYEEMEYAVQTLVRHGYVGKSIWLNPATSLRMGRELGSENFQPNQIFGLPFATDATVPVDFIEIHFEDNGARNKWRVWCGK